MTTRMFLAITAIEEYDDSIMPALPGVAKDAEGLREVLEKHVDIPIQHTTQLLNSQATKKAIIDNLQTIARDAAVTDRVLVYFGGHGHRHWDKESDRWKYHLVPCEATFDSAHSDGISTVELGNALSEINAKEVVVILDFCHGGGMASFPFTDEVLRELTDGWRSCYVMSASRGREEVGEDDSGGFFTMTLCEALVGDGVAPDEDGRISAQKAWAYAAEVATMKAQRRGHQQVAVSAGISSPIYLTRPVRSDEPEPKGDVDGSNSEGRNRRSPSVFQVGGAIDETHKDVYVDRDADRELWDCVKKMEYALVCAPRQQGKTSLLARLKRRLDEIPDSDTQMIFVDLSVMPSASEKVWYKHLGVSLAKDVSDLSAIRTLPRFKANPGGVLDFFECVARELFAQGKRLVVALDEVGSLPFDDNSQFFKNLRALHNKRAFASSLGAVTFAFSGVFSPENLISDRVVSPFNVARVVNLEDFDEAQVRRLVANGPWGEPQLDALAKRIFWWTDGNPIQTQALCDYLNPHGPSGSVDEAVQRLEEHAGRHFVKLNEELEGRVTLQDKLQQIGRGESFPFQPAILPWQAELRLLGLIKRDPNGLCAIRNRFYKRMLGYR